MTETTTPPTRDALVALLRASATVEQATQNAHTGARHALGAAIHAAYDAGMTVAEVADVLATIPEQVEYWSRAFHPDALDVEPAGTVTVTEAARQLGVTRVTLYRRIETGRVRTTPGPSGSPRVAVDEQGAVIASDVPGTFPVHVSRRLRR